MPPCWACHGTRAVIELSKLVGCPVCTDERSRIYGFSAVEYIRYLARGAWRDTVTPTPTQEAR